MTVFCPFTTTGEGEALDQRTGEIKLVVYCNVEEGFVGHAKMMFVPERAIVNEPALGKERLNTVPAPFVPPPWAAPNMPLPEKRKPAGFAPPLFVSLGPAFPAKVYKVANPVPLVLSEKIVPQPNVPP